MAGDDNDAAAVPGVARIAVEGFVVFFAIGGLGLVAKIVENAGNKADNIRGNSTVWTTSIPSRSSLAAAKASSKSEPSNRLLTGSQFRLRPLVLLLSKDE